MPWHRKLGIGNAGGSGSHSPRRGFAYERLRGSFFRAGKEALEHGGDLGAGGVRAGGEKSAVAPEDAPLHRPGHRVRGPVGDRVRVEEAGQHLSLRQTDVYAPKLA